MQFKELKTLVKLYTQDSQSKVPDKFSEWQLLIKQSIQSLSDTIEIQDLITNNPDDAMYRDIYSIDDTEDVNYFIKEADAISDEDSKINIQEDLAMAVVYDLAQMFTLDAGLKQKYILDKEMVISNYNWNKYIKEELINAIRN
jgi:hypothetical protein